MSTGIKLGECPVSGGRRSDMMTLRNMRGAAADIYLIFRLNKNNAIYTRVSVVRDEWLMITIQEINVSWNRGAVLRVVRCRSVSVSTVTKYNMNDLSSNVRFTAGKEMFQFITYCRPAVERTSLLSNGQAKRPERYAIYSHPSSTESYEPLELCLHTITAGYSGTSWRQVVWINQKWFSY